MMKAMRPSKALVITINLVIFFALFLLLSAILVLHQPSLDVLQVSPIASPKGDEEGIGMKKIQEEEQQRLFKGLHGDLSIALVNVGDNEAAEWAKLGRTATVEFDQVSDNLRWNDLFPEWIDEEEENERPSCPEVPMPDYSVVNEVDMVVARLPCRRPEPGWARDVHRLQVHLVAANLAVRKGRRNGRGRLRVVLGGACRPMMEVFRSDDLIKKEGEWWFYEAELWRLEEKMALPVGSCKLALPPWREGDTKLAASPRSRREAYATVLHSSAAYVCGALALARSLIATATDRDLLLLHDTSIPHPKLRALAAAGWTLREIKRIRNPRAEKDSYNEYNYSKLRLWQLTNYSKIVFVDADVLVLRNMDFLFALPQLSAAGNDGVIFNSGVMVIEPSERVFRTLMQRRKDVVSYNGGDQGFLNEVFVWWHRLPRRVNFLKNFWSNTSAERAAKEGMLGAEPAELYAVHYLGLKPWLCYRDYDCNWNVDDQRVYASDVAHRLWWRLHDEEIGGSARVFCGLSARRRLVLDEDRRRAEEKGYADGHWRLSINDPRQFE